MFTTYYDTSGSAGDSPFMVTVGLLASEQQWLEFERRWDLLLKEFEIPRLHMTDLVAAINATSPEQIQPESPYKHFVGDWSRGTQLVKQCADLIGSTVTFLFIRGLNVNDYYSVNCDFALEEQYDTPISCVAGICAQRANAWFAARYPGDKCEHFHERGEKGWTRAIELLDALDVRLQTRCKVKSKGKVKSEEVWFEPFQGGDVVAWVFRRIIVDRLVRTENDRYKEWLEMFTRLPHEEPAAFTKPQIVEWCCTHPEYFPRRPVGARVLRRLRYCRDRWARR